MSTRTMRTPLPLSLNDHIAKWKDCRRCRLANTRSLVVIGRGSLPCDVFFIGEAPGDSEDATGLPFDGPAGDLFERIVRAAVRDGLTWAVTNVLGCIPRDESGLKAKPEYDEIEACKPRVSELARIANPKLIVVVGTIAKDYTEPGVSTSIPLPDVPLVAIIHPSAILQKPYAQRNILTQRAVVTVAKAIEKHIGGASS